jgi:hypothetical protein
LRVIPRKRPPADFLAGSSAAEGRFPESRRRRRRFWLKICQSGSGGFSEKCLLKGIIAVPRRLRKAEEEFAVSFGRDL